jgi:hypothetical protein
MDAAALDDLDVGEDDEMLVRVKVRGRTALGLNVKWRTPFPNGWQSAYIANEDVVAVIKTARAARVFAGTR